MTDFGVWDPQLVKLPGGKTGVDSKLVFKHKTDEQGRIVKYKSRFVARGFSQRPGEDYRETYSSVAKLVTGRLLLALAAIFALSTSRCDAPHSRKRYTWYSQGVPMMAQAGCSDC